MSLERIAEIRRAIEDSRLRREGRATPNQPTPPPSDAEILALLDAYEAQRPRGAGEVPAPGAEVLVKTRAGGARSVGFHDGSGDEPMWHTEDGTWSTDDIERWWPLPKGGEA